MNRLPLFVAVLLSLGASEARGQDFSGITSEDPVTWRLAVLESAHQGKKALPELEKHAEKAPERVRTALGIMLLEHEGVWPLVRAIYPGLEKLARPSFKEARKQAKAIEGVESFHTGEGAKLPASAQAHEKMRGLGGFAVPVVLKLCGARSPATRLHGAALIHELQATGAYGALKELGKEETQVKIVGGDWTSTERLGAYVKRELHTRRSKKPALEAERYLIRLTWPEGVDPVGTLREKGKTYEATSWEDFWKRARPHMKELVASE